MKKVKYLIIVLGLVLLVGCGVKEKTYEYTSENTKEKIKVTISDEYTLSESEPIKITKGDEEATLIFITKTNFEELKTLFDNKTLVSLDSGKKGDNEYYLYKVNEEYNYVLLINGTETGAALSSKSEDTTKKIAEKISFSK